MFITLLVASIVWLTIFIVSAAFDAWYELCRPSFFVNNIVGRALAVVLIAPLIITIATTALAVIPLVVLADLFDDPWKEDTAWLETWGTLQAAFEWFTQWAPAYVISGQE